MKLQSGSRGSVGSSSAARRLQLEEHGNKSGSRRGIG